MVGELEAKPFSHAFLYSDGKNAGSWYAGGSIQHSELYQQPWRGGWILRDRQRWSSRVSLSGQLDLNTLITPNSGAPLASATSINDAGQIGASASIGGRRFLLTPVRPGIRP